MALDDKIINLDINKPNILNLSAKQYDTTGARSFTFRLLKDGQVFDLTGLTVRIGGAKADGTTIFNDCTILDAKNGTVRVDLTTQMQVVAGNLNLELIIMQGTTRLSTVPFQISIIKSATNLSNVVSSNELDALNNALYKVDFANKRIDNLASLKEGSTTGDAELADIRVGADGTTYKSAGEAVRKQFNNVSNELFKIHISKNILPNVEVNNLAIESWSKDFNNCTYANTGSITTDTINVTEGTFLKLVNKDNTIPSFKFSAMFTDGTNVSYAEDTTIEVPKGMIKARFSFVNTQNKADAIIVCETKDEVPIYEPYGNTKKNLFAIAEDFDELKNNVVSGFNELKDIRVGADGTTYNSAGDSIRAQFNNINNKLFEEHISKNILPPTQVNDLLIASWLKDFDKCTYSNKGSITTNAISVTPKTFLKCINKDNSICNFKISAIFCDKNGTTSYIEGNIIEIPENMIKARFSFVNSQNMPDAIIVCKTKDETPVYEKYGDTKNKLFVSTDEFNSFKDSINGNASKVNKNNTISLNNVDTDELPLQNIDKTGGYTSIFRKIGIIGDSLSSGAQDIQDGGSAFDCWEHSWGSYLGRATGAEIIKLCKGGLMTSNWHSVFEADAREENNKCTAYILMLGHNGQLTGSIDDVNGTSLKDSKDTTYGQYAKIIGTLREVAPQAKIFCVTYPIKYVEAGNKNKMIREVASKLNCYLIDLYKYGIDKDIFSNIWNQTGIGNPEKDKEKVHFTPLAYLKWSWEIQSYIDYIIRHNSDDFVNVGYINTSYTFD